MPSMGLSNLFVDPGMFLWIVFSIQPKRSNTPSMSWYSLLSNGTILWLSSSNGGVTNNLDLAGHELAKWTTHFDVDEHGIANAGFNGRWSALTQSKHFY